MVLKGNPVSLRGFVGGGRDKAVEYENSRLIVCFFFKKKWGVLVRVFFLERIESPGSVGIVSK